MDEDVAFLGNKSLVLREFWESATSDQATAVKTSASWHKA